MTLTPFEMPSAPSADAHYLRVCESTIAETRALIRDIEVAQMHPQKKRRSLFRARLRLAQLEAAADRVRHATGGDA